MKAGFKAWVGAAFFMASGLVGSYAEDTVTKVRLYALDCGQIDMLDLGIFSHEGVYNGEKNSAVDGCFLIRHPKGDLLWDTGLPEGLIELPEGLVNGAFHIKVTVRLTDQLQQLGMAPQDVEYLSISHSHFDHVGNAGKFAASTFLVHADERAHMFRDEAKADEQMFAAYSALETANTVEFIDKHDVFGDGSVEIIPTPGHTPGHTALLVKLENSGPVLLTGDLYHLSRARELGTVPTFNTDIEETLRSMNNFEEIATAEGARVVIQHERSDFEDLPKFPAYLD